MRLGINIGLVAGAALIGSLGFASLGQAAPLAGLAGATVKVAGEPSARETLVKAAYYHHHYHHHYHRHYRR